MMKPALSPGDTFAETTGGLVAASDVRVNFNNRREVVRQKFFHKGYSWM